MTVQPHPETQRLAAENALLREELARLLAEMEDLTHTRKPNLLALCQTKRGQWELRALRAQCEAARFKRKLELAQSALNQGRQPDLAAMGCPTARRRAPAAPASRLAIPLAAVPSGSGSVASRFLAGAPQPIPGFWFKGPCHGQKGRPSRLGVAFVRWRPVPARKPGPLRS